MSKEKDDSFNARLQSAERRYGLVKEEKPQVDANMEADRSLAALAFRAGTEMLAGLVVGVAIGWGLDHWLHTRALFLVIFALLGGSAGMLNVWRLVRTMDVK
ncbi:MAG: AtpZ/AtpI family protein [Acetobacter sp.]|jgi:ATP synthase protein I|uniref:ATP synthase protein I n=1 Tax=Acetobacter lovaniensis TaxID=104100 RepID=A0A841QFE5_9PROT|nr:AtpZ/AtpI family protein [Acetobacter lovaniensis]MBB6457105.1 ATP synthase protein I [Acetobacter lovaniensis]MCI1697688.1 AtpZ/AtpI family protein [Acetobacter lovaniensis]MCI1795784.1 AtpZ/AtpI family protein [Acetobacter lovaniensis]MCP1239551.1 AtpZ/AtpI family protein [Acetobacter lovaniensis]NHN81310.1 F0F1 ATP synthase assembly protein I [Acetobacter lovaniensis]